MNERIKELSAIAKNLTTDDAIHLSRIHNRTLSLDELGEIFEQKFAELLIQECMSVCKSRVGNSDYNTGRMHCVSDIKEHFGVE